MKNRYLKYFPYEEKGFETIIDDDPLNIIYSRDYLYVSQNIFIITLPDEFIVEVDINCSYRLKYEFEKKFLKRVYQFQMQQLLKQILHLKQKTMT